MSTPSSTVVPGVRKARRHRRRRDRVRALLAGFLVLGLGVSATMAAWADSVNVKGDFGTGSFNIQASIDGGTTWLEMDVLPGGLLSFPLSAGNLTPGDTVYAAVLLRIDPTKDDFDAVVNLNGATTTSGLGSLVSDLRYGAKKNIASAVCNAAGYAANGLSLVGLGSLLNVGSGATTFELENDGTPVGVCLAVSLPILASVLSMGDGISAAWSFSATSKDPD